MEYDLYIIVGVIVGFLGLIATIKSNNDVDSILTDGYLESISDYCKENK